MDKEKEALRENEADRDKIAGRNAVIEATRKPFPQVVEFFQKSLVFRSHFFPLQLLLQALG